MTISTILLVPEEGDPHGLLAAGVCGARPPVMCLASADEPWAKWCGDTETCTRALVLAHDGKPVPEGCDRADHALGDPDDDPTMTRGRDWTRWVAYTLRNPSRDAPRLRRQADEWNCVVIFLDAAGHEVIP